MRESERARDRGREREHSTSFRAEGRERFHTKPTVSDFFTPLLTRFSQCIYLPRGLLALLGFSRPQTGLCAAPLRQRAGWKQTSYTPHGAPDIIASCCCPTRMPSQPFSHTYVRTERHFYYVPYAYICEQEYMQAYAYCIQISTVTHTHAHTTVGLVWDWLKQFNSRAKDKKSWASMKPLCKRCRLTGRAMRNMNGYRLFSNVSKHTHKHANTCAKCRLNLDWWYFSESFLLCVGGSK